MNIVLNKYKKIYVFILIVALIGLISGYMFSKYQSKETKDFINDSININEVLENSTNNTLFYLKKDLKITLLSLTPITAISNIIDIFYEPFTIGFIINTFGKYSLKFKIIFLTTYYIIPLIITLIIIKNSLMITYNIFRLVIKKDNKNKTIKILKKQLILILISISYEIIIWLYSGLLNNYLLKIL